MTRQVEDKTTFLVISVMRWSCVWPKMKHENIDIFSKVGKLFTLNIPHHKTFTQHNIYTIFDKIVRFSCFIFIHTRLQRGTLTTRNGVFIFRLSGQEDVCIGIVSRNQGLKAPLLSYRDQPCMDWWKMWCMFPRVVNQCQLKGFWSLVDLCLAPVIASQSDQPVGDSACPQWSLYSKIWTPKDGDSSSWWV